MNSSDLKIWAVINLTPDSFYPPSRSGPLDFVSRCTAAINNGADILDIGAESTRPFARTITAEEEWSRLQIPLSNLKSEIGDAEFFLKVSIDTTRPETARKSLELGAGIINDVSGGEKPEMVKTVAEFNAGFVIMHSQGSPATMQVNPQYDNVVSDVEKFLLQRTVAAIAGGISKDKIIWDCGIGFGKTLDHNLSLLSHVDALKSHGYPLLYAVSRKSFIDKLLNIPDVELRKDPTLIIHTYLAMKGADILRVHDVEETVMIRNILEKLL